MNLIVKPIHFSLPEQHDTIKSHGTSAQKRSKCQPQETWPALLLHVDDTISYKYMICTRSSNLHASLMRKAYLFCFAFLCARACVATRLSVYPCSSRLCPVTHIQPIRQPYSAIDCEQEARYISFDVLSRS